MRAPLLKTPVGPCSAVERLPNGLGSMSVLVSLPVSQRLARDKNLRLYEPSAAAESSTRIYSHLAVLCTN